MVRNLIQDVAGRLVVIRTELRLTQTEMARYLEIDRGRYWHWESFAANRPPKPPPKRPPKNRAKPKPQPAPKPRDQGNLPAIDVMILLAEKTNITLDYIYRGAREGLHLAMAIRLLAREQGIDPDAPEFLTPSGKKALRAKVGV